VTRRKRAPSRAAPAEGKKAAPKKNLVAIPRPGGPDQISALLHEGLAVALVKNRERAPDPDDYFTDDVRVEFRGHRRLAVEQGLDMDLLPMSELYWYILEAGMPALLDALADAYHRGEERYAGNTLSAIGNLVSAHVRRAMLLAVLNEHRWVLSDVAKELGLSSAGNVTRAIYELGLEEQLAQASEQGLARHGVHRSGPPRGPKSNL
jgi:hypothetical protein